MIALAVAVIAAVVTGDHVALRAAPERTAAQQAALWKGDWLEVRGERRGWLEVYDHRHDRPGWIARHNARVIKLDEAAAPALRAVVDFLRDAPGSESLGIAYAALYMKVAPRGGIDADLLVSLGTLSQRLADHASHATDPATSEQIEVAQSWGVVLASVELSGATRICYDGAAFRQALALTPSPDDAATSVLALTDPACDPALPGATAQAARDEAELSLLERVDPTRVAGPLGNRVRLRRAMIGARLAWAVARGGDVSRASKLAEDAVDAFARLERSELADEDIDSADAAALAVASARWAALPAQVPGKDAPKLAITAGEPGETCVTVASSPAQCTHGQLWPASFRMSPDRHAAVIAVAPLPGWLELWVFRRASDGGWTVDVLAPATDAVDLGYVELAGWSPDGTRALLVREARADGKVRRELDLVRLDTLAVEKQSATLSGLGAAKRWASADWRGRTVALR
jgi:hypothetical protein